MQPMPARPFDPMQQAQQLFTGHHAWLLSRLPRLRKYGRGTGCGFQTFLRVVAAPNLAPIAEPRAFLTTIAKRLLFTLSGRREACCRPTCKP
jgi:RNA polymerase sigma-70 factor (ECF subfamily)